MKIDAFDVVGALAIVGGVLGILVAGGGIRFEAKAQEYERFELIYNSQFNEPRVIMVRHKATGNCFISRVRYSSWTPVPKEMCGS